MKAVDQRSWDPAVKALTQFPSVLDNLAKNLAWTSALGEASATQQQDVMAAIQRMRAKAHAAGNLKSSPEIKVVQENPQTIVIQPANPQIVYVPTYNPTVVYGYPVVVSGYTSSDVATAAVLSFGVGIAVGAMIHGGCCGWGWGYWGTSWHSRTIIYNRNVYVGNSYWRGGYYGGGYRPPGYVPPRYPSHRPPSYPGYGRPSYPSNRPPATTLPTNGGNRPGGGNRPPATTLPANGGNRPDGSNRPNGEIQVHDRLRETALIKHRLNCLQLEPRGPVRTSLAVINVSRRRILRRRQLHSKRVQMRSRDRVEDAHKALAEIKAWAGPAEIVVEEAASRR